MNNILYFHQCGFRDVWNKDCYIHDKVGHGLILSPVNTSPEKIYALPIPFKQNCLFDPQFYLPASKNDNLLKYDFFPANITNGYTTDSFLGLSKESAKRCIDFQIRNRFRYIIIPTFFVKNISPDYTEKILGNLILPYIEYINKNDIKVPVLLTFFASDIAIDEKQGFRNDFLNLLTSFKEIKGVYLIPYNEETSKRIKDTNFLMNMLHFINILRNNDLEVHIGYTDIENILYTAVDPTSLSLGSYENLRRFRIDRFEKPDPESTKRGPTPRIFSPFLLQWIDYNYLGAIRQRHGDIIGIFGESPYLDLMMKPGYNWNFQKAEPYKHYFYSYNRLLSDLPSEPDLRYNWVIGKIDTALGLYSILNKSIKFGPDDDDSHLYLWKTVLQTYFT